MKNIFITIVVLFLYSCGNNLSPIEMKTNTPVTQEGLTATASQISADPAEDSKNQKWIQEVFIKHKDNKDFQEQYKKYIELENERNNMLKKIFEDVSIQDIYKDIILFVYDIEYLKELRNDLESINTSLAENNTEMRESLENLYKNFNITAEWKNPALISLEQSVIYRSNA